MQSEVPSVFHHALTRVSIFTSLVRTCARDRRGSYYDLVFAGFAHMLRIFIFAAMYKVAFGSTRAHGYIDAVWAVSLAQTMFAVDRPPLTVTMGEEIKDGTIAVFLLKPLSYVYYSFFSYLGKCIPSICVTGLFCCIAAGFLTRAMPGSILEIILALIPILGGVSIVLLIATTLGLFGFWMHDTSSLHWIDHKMSLLFGGLIIPLVLLPDTVQAIVRYTPWTTALAQPARVLTDFSLSQYVILLCVQVFWITVLCALSHIIIKRGIGKLVILGG